MLIVHPPMIIGKLKDPSIANDHLSFFFFYLLPFLIFYLYFVFFFSLTIYHLLSLLMILSLYLITKLEEVPG